MAGWSSGPGFLSRNRRYSVLDRLGCLPSDPARAATRAGQGRKTSHVQHYAHLNPGLQLVDSHPARPHNRVGPGYDQSVRARLAGLRANQPVP